MWWLLSTHWNTLDCYFLGLFYCWACNPFLLHDDSLIIITEYFYVNISPVFSLGNLEVFVNLYFSTIFILEWTFRKSFCNGLKITINKFYFIFIFLSSVASVVEWAWVCYIHELRSQHFHLLAVWPWARENLFWASVPSSVKWR